MIKTYIWIYISSAITIVLAKTYPILNETEYENMKSKWDQCCSKNKCIKGSCYIVEWGMSTWPSVRQRCQSLYPEWPHNIDIFQIRNESDIETFRRLLNVSIEIGKEYPTSIWTSGTRCPRSNANETEMQKSWTSTREPFPDWLNERINETFPNVREDVHSCEFLVLLSSPTHTEVKYQFQDQNAQHPTICEFIFSDGNYNEVELTPELTTNNVSPETIEGEETAPSISLPTKMPLNPKIKYEWEKCCEENKCIGSSCYFVQLEPANWATVSQRCQTYYPVSLRNVNIFRILSETDIDTFRSIMQNVKEPPTTLWTSGARCPNPSSSGNIWQTQWISTREPFPAWLDEKFSKTHPGFPNAKNANECEFLVISLSNKPADGAKYEFQDRNAHHSGICEFTFPDAKLTTESEEQNPLTVSSAKGTTKTIATTTRETKSHSRDEFTSPMVTTISPSTTISVWIDSLDVSIRNGDNALNISEKLSKETKRERMSHEDISALIKVTSSLLQLYRKQKHEQQMHQNQEVNFTQTMIASISNMLRTEIKDAWEFPDESRQTREASEILKLVTSIGVDLSCIKRSDEKLQYTVSEKNIDLQTFILNNRDEVNDVIIFPQENEKVKSGSSIRLPSNLQLEKWFSPCKNFNTGVGVMYKQIGDFLKAGQRKGISEIASDVLSFFLGNTTESISLSEDKVNITLEHFMKEGLQYENPRCVFWNFSKSDFGAWDDSGCERLSYNETHSECQCDHLTNFAILMDVGNRTEVDDPILRIMTYVCCGLSSVSLVFSLVCFVLIRSLHGRRSIITGNLAFTLLITNLLVLFGLKRTENQILCAVIAGVLQYSILSSFFWMLVEGYHLYRMVILVFQRGSNLPVKFYYIFAYGSPLVIVAISAGLKSDGYGKGGYCWLSSEDHLRWSFVGPACAIILINSGVFLRALCAASSVKIKREQSTTKKFKSWVVGSFSVMCLLGLTWCTGLVFMAKILYPFAYVFTILNGLQGVFIFLFHILMNDKVTSLCSSKDITAFGRRKRLNHTSSNQTNSKTSTRTSLGFTSSAKIPDSRKQSALSILRNCYISHGDASDINRSHSNQNGNVLCSSVENGARRLASPM